MFSRKEMGNVMKSFTEKKLTALMVAICFIYMIGNVPQMAVMVLQNETTENKYGFQVSFIVITLLICRVEPFVSKNNFIVLGISKHFKYSGSSESLSQLFHFLYGLF